MGIGLIIALALSFLVFAVLIKVVKSAAMLALHGLFGLIVFWALGYFGIVRVPIDVFTFLIAAFGGVVGVLAVIALSFLGIPL
ncbi:MAG: pro-sigmaK processing inhibitor BofA family protein [Candidatus Micrarchaeia archaeon]